MDVLCEFQIYCVNPFNKMYGNLDNDQLHHEIKKKNAEVGYEGATPPDYPASIKAHVITMNCRSFLPDFITLLNINC